MLEASNEFVAKPEAGETNRSASFTAVANSLVGERGRRLNRLTDRLSPSSRAAVRSSQLRDPNATLIVRESHYRMESI